jgi:hypothetical protein
VRLRGGAVALLVAAVVVAAAARSVEGDGLYAFPRLR